MNKFHNGVYFLRIFQKIFGISYALELYYSFYALRGTVFDDLACLILPGASETLEGRPQGHPSSACKLLKI
jgi:hypothetical protein